MGAQLEFKNRCLHTCNSRDELAAFMRARGVRALPTAVLGSGWDEAAARPPAQAEDAATLHGQHSGGL